VLVVVAAGVLVPLGPEVRAAAGTLQVLLFILAQPEPLGRVSRAATQTPLAVAQRVVVARGLLAVMVFRVPPVLAARVFLLRLLVLLLRERAAVVVLVPPAKGQEVPAVVAVAQ
jgi:hypothetical protein